MRILLLSAYEAVSHRYWANTLMAEVTEVEWTLLSLPARHFSWRIRGNPLSWWLKEQATLSQCYDVVLATSMVDIATLVGLFPHLGQARKVVYFHENQFAYPESSQQIPQVEAKMVNLYAALAADELVFNTAYNRDSFFDGARRFLKKMPENLPAAQPLERLRRAARIVPVPIAAAGGRAVVNPNPQRLIWNHRWEYDKNPEDFFKVLFKLSEQQVPFELAVLGQQFREVPGIFAEAQERLAAHIVCWGAQPESEYCALLEGGGIVVSTTWHEFQGLAIMEATQRGATPLVPDRLCFPELYPNEYRYDGTQEGLFHRLKAWLLDPTCQPAPLDTCSWEWPQWQAVYRQLLMQGASSDSMRRVGQ